MPLQANTKIVLSEKQTIIKNLLYKSFETRQLSKAIFSKPLDSTQYLKVSAILIRRKNNAVLQLEIKTHDKKAIHKNIRFADFDSVLTYYIPLFRQINIITPHGECEYKNNQKSTGAKEAKEHVLGADKLMTRLNSAEIAKLDTINAHNKQKKYILQGDEPFLIYLGISDKSGRPHDKIEKHLPKDGELTIYDLCCGKSYLTFAAYYYFTSILKRDIFMIGVDLKEDVISFCENTAKALNFDSLTFINEDISKFAPAKKPHLVISLHACDTATDIVLDFAAKMSADVILSTPCCQNALNQKLNSPALSFISRHSILRRKFCDAATDALRLKRLEYSGYSVSALELTDPDDTPKNILLRAVRKYNFDPDSALAHKLRAEYKEAVRFLTGEENGYDI